MRKNILITGSTGFIGRKIEGGRQFEGDILNRFDFNLHGIKGIVHLAAKSAPRCCEREPEACLRTNLLGLLNILEIALQHNLWVIFISSFQIRERNLYGLSKLLGEELCRIYKRRGLKVRILRLPIIFGPGDTPEKFINKILRGENPPVKGNRRFHFLHVEDAIKFIEREVDVLDGKVWGKKITLTEFKEGVHACLSSKPT